MRRIVALSFAVLLAAVCFLASPSGSASDARKVARTVTFSKDVAPIFNKHCVECHRPNDIAPMALMSFKDARPWARSIKEKVVTREMPPWSADPKHGEFANDKRMTEAEIDTIVAWVDQGAKEGNPKDMPAPPEFTKKDGWAIGKPDVVLTMAEEWTVQPDAPDNYINFFLPTNFTEDKWVQAVEIKPGNKKVVHHVIAFIQSPQMMEKRRAAGDPSRRTNNSSIMYLDGSLRRVKMDAPVVDDQCSQPPSQGGGQRGGGGEENEGALLAGFAPGLGATVFSQGTAKRVPKGATIMFQMHYSAFRGALAGAEKDRTSIALLFAKEPPEKMALTAGVANLTFKIPAGADNHQVASHAPARKRHEVRGYLPGRAARNIAVGPEVQLQLADQLRVEEAPAASEGDQGDRDGALRQLEEEQVQPGRGEGRALGRPDLRRDDDRVDGVSHRQPNEAADEARRGRACIRQ
jgi:mono/diheme cytochrome c family protein